MSAGQKARDGSAGVDEGLDLRVAQRRDPVEAGRLEHLLDLCRGDHAAVAHHHDMTQVEALLELVDLGLDRRRVTGVALEHLDRDRAA